MDINKVYWIVLTLILINIQTAVVSQSGTCPTAKFGHDFGPDCQFHCNCRDSAEVCNKQTGACPTSGCARDRMGPGCQYDNVALSAVSEEAVDKALDADGVSTCTDLNGDNPWIIVIMTGFLNVSLVHIHFKSVENMHGFEVQISDSDKSANKLCYKDNGKSNSTFQEIRCNEETYGDWLIVSIQGISKRLEICDLKINGGRSLAYKRPTSQSSTATSSGTTLNSKFAVDGGLTTRYLADPRTCTKTKDGSDPWWYVDLSGKRMVSRIRVYNADTRQSELKNFRLYLGLKKEQKNMELVYTDKEKTPALITEIQLQDPIKARYVRIRLEGNNKQLSMCEVQVFGDCVKNTCGFNCDISCYCNSTVVGLEDRMTGRCPHGCQHGWSGLDDRCDTPCTDGLWGPDCKWICGSCKDGAACNVVNGSCPNGCGPGYLGVNCTTPCQRGKFGYNCNDTCGNCLDGNMCHPSTGVCVDGCDPGYKNDGLCKSECPITTYGQNCNGTCGKCKDGAICSRITGYCGDGCAVGIQPPYCTSVCDFGTYGAGCMYQCGPCANGLTCNNVNGTCDNGCAEGYAGDFCTEAVGEQRSPRVAPATIGMIAGTVIGSLVLIAAIMIVIFLIRKKQRAAVPVLVDQFVARKKNNKYGLDASYEYDNTVAISYDEIYSKSNTNHVNSQNFHNDEAAKGSFPDDHDSTDLTTPMGLVMLQDLWNYAQKCKADRSILDRQFNDLPQGALHLWLAATKPENARKNKYKGIYPYDSSRVVLQPMEDDDGNDYINASFINGYNKRHAYIAAQGPTDTTLNDFWRMIWQQKCARIVMLTRTVEHSKQKCVQYWPEEGEIQYGAVVVGLVGQETFADFDVRVLSVKADGSHPRHVKQFHYTAWPDRDVPDYTSSVVQFWNKVKTSGPETSAPVLIHCSAGIGRTGTFIALDYLVDQADLDGQVDFMQCVKDLRHQRVNMVQTKAQYIFLHDAVAEAILCPSTPVPIEEFPKSYIELRQIDRAVKKSWLMLEFEKLQDILSIQSRYANQHGRNEQYVAAQKPENREKNRFCHILPAEEHRPYLHTMVAGCNDYINAVFMPAHKKQMSYIVTQTPLPDTAVDFWRLVYEQNVSSIIMMNEIDEMWEDGHQSSYYWPKKDEVVTFAPFEIRYIKEVEYKAYVERTMELNYTRDANIGPKVLKQYMCKFWPRGRKVPNDFGTILTMLENVQKWQHVTGDTPIVVHCMNGAERSGLFCIIANLVERMKIDHDVAIQDVIKQMRIRRRQILPNFEQYKYCHDVVLEFLNRFEAYSNFTI